MPTASSSLFLLATSTMALAAAAASDHDVTPADVEKDAESIYNTAADGINICMIIVGVLMTFLGYKYKRTTLATVGFCVGGGFAYVLVDTLFPDAWGGFPAVALVGVGALVGALTAYFMHLGLFAAGASLGVVLAMLLQTAVLYRLSVEPSGLLMYIAMAVFGLILGLLALKLERPLLIIATSYGGAFLATYGVGHFIGNTPSPFSLGAAIDNAAASGVESVPSTWWIMLGVIAGVGTVAACLQHFVIAKKKAVAADDTYLVLEAGNSNLNYVAPDKTLVYASDGQQVVKMTGSSLSYS